MESLTSSLIDEQEAEDDVYDFISDCIINNEGITMPEENESLQTNQQISGTPQHILSASAQDITKAISTHELQDETRWNSVMEDAQDALGVKNETQNDVSNIDDFGINTESFALKGPRRNSTASESPSTSEPSIALQTHESPSITSASTQDTNQEETPRISLNDVVSIRMSFISRSGKGLLDDASFDDSYDDSDNELSDNEEIDSEGNVEKNQTILSASLISKHHRNHHSMPPPASSITAQLAATARKKELRDIILFGICGMGATLGPTAVLSSLVYYSTIYGEDSFLYLNLAVFCPLLPMSLIQARHDSDFDQKFSSRKSFLFRGSFALGLSTIMICFIPLTTSLKQLCGVAAVLGCCAILQQNILLQLASFVGYSNPLISSKIKTSVTMGLQASAILTLLTSLTFGFGSDGDFRGKQGFYDSIAVMEFGILLCFWYLISESKMVQTGLVRRDHSFVNLEEEFFEYNNNHGLGEAGDRRPHASHAHQHQLKQQAQQILNSFDDNDSNHTPNTPQPVEFTPIPLGMAPCAAEHAEITYLELIRQTYPILCSLILTVSTSTAMAAWFTHVKSGFAFLPQILFYVRLAFDLIGRPATLLVPELATPKPNYSTNLYSSSVSLAMIAIPRALIFVPLFFMCAHQTSLFETFPRRDDNDVVLVALVAGLSVTSGYINTAAYQIAPQLLYHDEICGGISEEKQEELASKQASLLNIAFSFAVVLGVCSSLLFGGSL